MLSVVLTPQMSHILRIWRTILTRRPKFIGKLQSRTKVLEKYSYFSVISGFHHTLWNPEKICGYTRPTLFVGLGLCELENAQKRKSVPRIFSVIVALNCHSESSLAVLPRLRIIIQSILTVFAFGIRNSPGSSTSAVDVVKLLRKRHLSSNKKELKNGRKKKNNKNLPSPDWTGKGGRVVNSGWYLLRTNIDLHSKGHVWYWVRARSNWIMGLIYGKRTIEQSVSTPN